MSSVVVSFCCCLLLRLLLCLLFAVALSVSALAMAAAHFSAVGNDSFLFGGF